MDKQQAALLVETNENLVISVLKAHAQRAEYERKIFEITNLAGTDVLTGLPNRMILNDRLGHAIVNAERSGDRLAILFVDLNKFKHINDTLGHAAGDQVLKTAAHCMTKSVRASDTVSRHGGDEFVILLERVSTMSDVTEVIEKIVAALGASNRIGPDVIRLTASIGISLYPDDGDNTDVLLSRADSAMYRAKRSGKARFVFAGAGTSSDPGNAPASPALPVELFPGERELRTKHRREVDAQMASATLAAQAQQADAELALRRQTEFMATLAHELRTPLGPIRNAALIIRHTPPDAATAKKIHGVIDRQVIHMTKLLDDVFDMSRITTGKLRIELEAVDIGQVLGQALEIVQAPITARNQILTSTLPDLPAKMSGDRTRLVQIFANLLDNASKYTPEAGSIFVTLKADATSVRVTIADTGIGITAEAMATIFDLFVQEEHAVRFNNRGRGLGIGLALVKNLVEAHNGTISACSAGSGLGSQFTVIFAKLPDVP